MASAPPEIATSWATKGISKLPGTQWTAMSFSAAPWPIRASMAPLRSRWDTTSLKRATTMATRIPVASTWLLSAPPSPTFMGVILSHRSRPGPRGARLPSGGRAHRPSPARAGGQGSVTGGLAPGSAGGVEAPSAGATARAASKR